jgi:TolA-binding protein
MKTKIGLLVFTCVALAGCGTTSMQREIETLRSQLRDMRALQADNTASIATLEERVRGLSGEIEERTGRRPAYKPNYNSGSQPQDSYPKSSVSSSDSTPYSGVPTELIAQDERLARSIPAPTGPKFLATLDRLKTGRITEASRLLGELGQEQAGEAGAEISFWQAVVLDIQGNTRNALSGYNTVVTQYAGNPRSARALERIAEILLKMGDKDTAKVTYQKLAVDFPGSAEGRRAEKAVRSIR